jgi:hypothetical protein
MNLASARKAVTGLVGALYLWEHSVPSFAHLTRGDWEGLAFAIGTGLGVYHISNAVPELVAGPAVEPNASSLPGPYVPVAPTTVFPPLTPAPVGVPIPADPPVTHGPYDPAPAVVPTPV